MSDVRNVFRFLADERKRQRASRIAYYVFSALLLLGAMGLLWLSWELSKL